MVSGYADVRIAVEVMTLGAVTLLETSFRLDELLAHLRRALELHAARRSYFRRSGSGRFRDYLKAALIHLVFTSPPITTREQRAQRRPLSADIDERAGATDHGAGN
jgi:DNA-binding NtrC family response regulator